jgi:hypothetical protein
MLQLKLLMLKKIKLKRKKICLMTLMKKINKENKLKQHNKMFKKLNNNKNKIKKPKKKI